MDSKQKLKELVKKNAVKTGEFVLSSGGKSNFYVDGKQITLHPEGLNLIAEIILEKIERCKLPAYSPLHSDMQSINKQKKVAVEGIGGMTLGADPIAAAVALLSAQRGKPIPAFIVRKTQKEHGLQKKIEGIITPNSKVVIVDDVITKGSATLGAIAAVEEIGCTVVKVICLVDRQEGGAEALQKYDFDPIFRKEELM